MIIAARMSIAGTIRSLGAATALSYGLARATARLPRISYYRYRLLAVPRQQMPAMPRGWRTEVLSPEMLSGHAVDAPVATQQWRFGQGMTCLAAFDGDLLVGVTWLTSEPFVDDEVRIRFVPPAGAAWDTGLWIHPERRLGRGFAALWAGTAHWLADRGLDWSASRIADYNLASIRSHLRMGAAELGTLTAFGLAGHQIALGAQPGYVGAGGACADVRIRLAA
jgi:hypothetical protein